MSTNEQFKTFLKERLTTESFNNLNMSDVTFTYAPPSLSFVRKSSALLSMMHKKLSDDILILIAEFFDSIPFDKATKYVNMQNGLRCSILFCEDSNLLKIMIKYVADINARDYERNNALIHTCSNLRNSSSLRANLEIVKLLLSNGINVNNTNLHNYSALIYCCQAIVNPLAIDENIEEIIELLIFNGANPFVETEWGSTAYDCVRNSHLLPERLSGLLKGTIKINNTKRATHSA